ncbi:para-nitrobenzyl esterase [Paraburkholderia sp. GAS333]|uniref:carboxylesterase/lipase family protein n=1 Tax=Paraburkholderia sp. GAS333 TaxID=3156279 RepID=UPI003D21962C
MTAYKQASDARSNRPARRLARTFLRQGIAAVCAWSMLTAWPAHADNADDAAVITTRAGALRGVEHGVVDVYQGIPYAAPPVGDLRWRAPQPAASWTGIRDATQPGNACVQSATFWRPGNGASWHEDCLNLNVWKPRHVDAHLPVIVWFHGGGWINGAGADMQPVQIASQGNIVVTVDYRLGALGYLALPALDAESSDRQSSGNYGDLDKISALKWVRQNIAAFGGDPDNVSIGGQSAGAGSVCWLLASPAAKGLFNRAIIESIGDCAIVSHDTATTRGKTFAEALGCTDPSTEIACLRRKSPADIIDAQVKTNLTWRPVTGGSAQPVPVLDAFRSGNFNRVPVLVGNVRHETRVFVYEGNDMVRQPLTPDGYRSSVQTQMGDKASRVLAEYPLNAYPSAGVALAAVQTDSRFACGSVPVADALSAWVPTYTYEFRDDTAPHTPYMVVPPSFEIGAAHSSELQYIWRGDAATPVSSGQSSGYLPLSPEQSRLSQMMQTYWASFARTGNPNTATQPDWPRYDTAKTQRLGLLPGGATDIITGDAYAKEHHCGFWAAMQ